MQIKCLDLYKSICLILFHIKVFDLLRNETRGRIESNVFMIQIDATSFAEFEISEFEISRFDCIALYYPSVKFLGF